MQLYLYKEIVYFIAFDSGTNFPAHQTAIKSREGDIYSTHPIVGGEKGMWRIGAHYSDDVILSAK